LLSTTLQHTSRRYRLWHLFCSFHIRHAIRIWHLLVYSKLIFRALFFLFLLTSPLSPYSHSPFPSHVVSDLSLPPFAPHHKTHPKHHKITYLSLSPPWINWFLAKTVTTLPTFSITYMSWGIWPLISIGLVEIHWHYWDALSISGNATVCTISAYTRLYWYRWWAA